MFFIDIEPKANNTSIYKLKSLLHTKITVKSPKPKKPGVQCKRCQQFGHTHSYGTLPQVCVRCGTEHNNRNCIKPENTKPKCANCPGEYPTPTTEAVQNIKNARSLRSEPLQLRPPSRGTKQSQYQRYPPLETELTPKQSLYHPPQLERMPPLHWRTHPKLNSY